MARKTRLTTAAVKIGTAVGRADRTARKVAKAAEVAREELAELSKRVEELVPGYEKPFLGTLAALEVGFDAIRVECPNFRQWLEYLEALPK